MSFSKKDLFREIKIKCEPFNDEDYLKNAVAIIDSAVDTAEVDGVFLNEYYKLKRRIVFESTYSSTVVLGLIVGLIGSFAAAVADVFDNVEIPEIIMACGTGIFVAVVISGLLICGFVLYNGLNKQNSVLYPYLEKKMEDKILGSRIQYTKPKKEKTSVVQRIKQLIKDNKFFLLVVSIIAIIVFLYSTDSVFPQRSQLIGKYNLKSVCVILISGFFIFEMRSLLFFMKHRVFRWLKNWSVIFWVVLITLAIPIGVHFKFFSDKPFTQETLLSAYTEYLSFLGAFALGYYLYKREEIRNFEALKKKARMIYESMQYITINFENIDFFIERGETYPIPENWRSDYLDIKHLVKYEESALGSELQYFYGRVDSINKAIVAGNKERAQKLYLTFVQKEQYSSSEYNYMNAAEVLLLISLDMPQHKTWKKAEKEQIKKYADAFFDVVNLRVYNYLIKNHLSSCDLDVIEYELVDWLLQNPELNAWVKHPYDKRKISEVVFLIALSMNKKSPNLNYCWREFSIK